ncbi:MAG: ATP-binding protein [Bdellovibrionia bacterium]
MRQPALTIPILLVDDRPENLLVLDAVLDQPEYRLVKATSGREALGLLLHQEFAVILLDAQMPEMDGFETAKLIRENRKTRNTPIIFLTAIYSDIQHIKKGYASGAVDYMSKPFDPEILRSKVAIFIELFQAKQELRQKNRDIAEKNLELERRERAIQEQCEMRVRAESQREKYQTLINGLDHSIIWEAKPKNMEFNFVSERAELLLGYPHKRWLSEPNFFFSLIPEEERDSVRQHFHEAVQTRLDQRFEHRTIAQDGQTYWFHTGIQFVQKDPNSPPVLQGLTVDITPLKLSEEDLRKREAKYRRVIDANMIGHFFANLKTGRISDANDYFLQVIGYTRDDLVNGRIDWFKMTPPEYNHLDLNAIQELQETGLCQPFEKEYIRKDGSHVPVMIGAARLDTFSDECACFVLDLSEKKQVEREKVKALRAREEMLEIVSHDLKNPLSAILMNAVLLFKKLPPEEPSFALRKQVENIQRSAQRMKSLIEDLLDLAKVEAGRLVVNPTAQHPEVLLSEAIDMMRPLAKEKGIHIDKEYCRTTNDVLCDKDRILQVFSNLIGNAIKFTPEQGHIAVSAEEIEHEIRFCISDTGAGISEEHLPHIFKRYWQAEGTQRQSAGLGLAITKGILDAHHGKLWVKSALSRGSTFCFTLPTQEPGK